MHVFYIWNKQMLSLRLSQRVVVQLYRGDDLLVCVKWPCVFIAFVNIVEYSVI